MSCRRHSVRTSSKVLNKCTDQLTKDLTHSLLNNYFLKTHSVGITILTDKRNATFYLTPYLVMMTPCLLLIKGSKQNTNHFSTQQ